LIQIKVGEIRDLKWKRFLQAVATGICVILGKNPLVWAFGIEWNSSQETI